MSERFEFEDIAGLSEAVLSGALGLAEEHVVATALLGASPAVNERVLSCLPESKRAGVEARLARVSPVRVSDVEKAQRDISSLIEAALVGEEG